MKAYLGHPRLEHLVKTGFYRLVADIIYGYGYLDRDCLDESQDRTHQILRVVAEDVSFLQGLDVDLSTLKMFQGYAGIKDRQRLLAWQLEHEVIRDIQQILRYMTVYKAIRYLDRQYGERYKDKQNLVCKYRDYLEICEKLDYDMKNSFILYPNDLKKSHDKVAHHLKHKDDARIKREFMAGYKDIAGKLDFEKDGMEIVYPSLPEDVIAEGHALHHCVGSYLGRIAKHECIILFLRRCEDKDEPFYTIEIRGNGITQVRGMQNCDMTPEVETFIRAWERCVLRTQLPAA